MNPQPHSRIILVLRHAQALCVSARKQYPASLLSSLGQPPQGIRSRAAWIQMICKVAVGGCARQLSHIQNP
jgi:hypothetical protein